MLKLLLLRSLFAALALLPISLFSTLQAQEKDEAEAAPAPLIEKIRAAIPGEAAKPEKKPEKEEPTVDVPRTAVVTHGPRYLKLHLFDGSVLANPPMVEMIDFSECT